jgi:thioredoxin-related protein
MNMKAIIPVALIACALPLSVRAAAPKGWTDNYEKAVETAKAENKDLLLDFTGSDWCGFCKMLDKEVFSTPQFASWAKKYVVLVQVDFPHSTPLSPAVKTQNSELASKYPVHGYPTIVVITPDGKEVAKQTGYGPGTGAATYIGNLEGQMKKAGPMPVATGDSASGGSSSNPKEPSIFKSPPPGFPPAAK